MEQSRPFKRKASKIILPVNAPLLVTSLRRSLTTVAEKKQQQKAYRAGQAARSRTLRAARGPCHPWVINN